MSPDIDKIKQAAQAGARLGVTEGLVAVNKLPVIITLSECKKLYGSSNAKKMRESPEIKWRPIGKGSKTSSVFASRVEVANFFLEKTLEDCANW